MRITKLHITNIRNHGVTEVEPGGSLNIFYGLNGSGKTSVIESVSICGFSKSFMPCQDASVVSGGAESYIVSCKAVNDYDVPYFVAVNYFAGKKKRINSTFGDNLNPKDIIGEMPMVILNPDYKMITFGAPSDRREFLDRLLSQAGKRYLEELMKLKKALKQRNNLLSQLKTGANIDYSLIEPWNDVFVKAAAEIIIRRRDFIRDFIPYFREVYGFIAGNNEEVSMNYQPDSLEAGDIETMDAQDIENIYSRHLIERMREEYGRGATCLGPQKDEIVITVNGRLARDTASQGQHKSLLISIKFAEFDYLKSMKNETPIILLDDIFAELDNERADKVIQLIKSHKAQTFITLTDKSHIDGFLEGIDRKSFHVSNGVVVSSE